MAKTAFQDFIGALKRRQGIQEFDTAPKQTMFKAPKMPAAPPALPTPAAGAAPKLSFRQQFKI